MLTLSAYSIQTEQNEEKLAPKYVTSISSIASILVLYLILGSNFKRHKWKRVSFWFSITSTLCSCYSTTFHLLSIFLEWKFIRVIAKRLHAIFLFKFSFSIKSKECWNLISVSGIDDGQNRSPLSTHTHTHANSICSSNNAKKWITKQIVCFCLWFINNMSMCMLKHSQIHTNLMHTNPISTL